MNDELKAKAKKLRRQARSYAEIAVEVDRSPAVVRRWLMKRATAKQSKSYLKYRQSEKGRAAQRRYEAKRREKRKALIAIFS